MPDTPNKSRTFEHDKLKKHVDSLISEWSQEEEACRKRREVRETVINHEEEVRKNRISENEIINPRRIIDRNIRQQKPEQIAYIEQAPHLVLFRSRSNPGRNTTNLANWFTNGCRYPGWNIPWHRLFDATDLHGAAPIEVKLSASTPFSYELEAIPREDLIIPLKTRNSIQSCEMVLRRFHFLPAELEEMVDSHDFSEAAVKEITSKKTDDRTTPIEVFRIYIKDSEDVVHVGWYSQACQRSWLKDFEILDMGLEIDGTKIPITTIPIFFMLFEITEKEEILAAKGRAFKDLPDQDALTQLWSDVINGCHNATDLQASQVNNPAMHVEGAQAVPHKRNSIYPRELRYNQAQYPDAIILQVAQALSTENLSASGRVDFAVSNRKDARKTRAEILTATEQSNKLSSINIIPEGHVIVEVYSFIWTLIQTRIVANTLTPPPNVSPEEFEDVYDILPAGDTEVIKRAEEIATLQQDIPLFANTPLYPQVLAKYISLRYPAEAEQWNSVIAAPDLRPIVAQLIQVIQAIPFNKLQDDITPQQMQQLIAIVQNAQAALQQASIGAQPPAVAGGPNDGSAPEPPI